MESFAKTATLVYSVSIAVLGARLLWGFLLRGAPTGLLGIALLFGGAPVLVISLLLEHVAVTASAPVPQLLRAALVICAGIAGVCVMRFTYEVFRPHSRSLPWLIGAVCVYFTVAASMLPFSPESREIGASWMSRATFLLLFAIFAWASGESFRYWRVYRRVSDLEPFVVDRFRMWGVAAASVIPMIGLVLTAHRHAFAHALAACFGLFCTVALWLAFLPPRWYRRRLAAGAPSDGPARGA